MKHIILIFLLSFQIFSLVFANGGSIDVSYFKKTGNIRLLQKADISLLKEDLRIKIISDTTFIEVTYLLKNNGNTQTVYYGFPVDLYDTARWEGEAFVRKGYEKIKYFEAFVDGKPRKHSYWEQGNAYQSNMYSRNSLTKDVPIHRHWHQLNLHFEKDSLQELVIRYAVENRKIDGLGGLSFLPYATARNFVYDLFPSSSWSDGIVQDFSVTLDLSNLKKNRYKYEITGLENLQIDKDSVGIYNLTTKNFDLKERSFISIEYKNYDIIKGHYLPKIYSKLNVISIASSTPNANYLIDENPKTVWKGKEGDWVLVRFAIRLERNIIDSTRPIPINPKGIIILNGDYSSKENFDTSPKIETVQIKANDILLRKYLEYDKKKGAINYTSFIKLEKSNWFLANENIFEVGQSPLEREFIQSLSDPNVSVWKTHIETIAIYITKSSSESKEVSISDLYFF